ncbi:MAG: CRISPR-associated endonuclease Cas3'', partial [Candidatus Omnitrophica bacterium]|nr:CRISPR-associated endonuclease Cas3'' [Candidatus Omnitrophota bacterium]
MIAKHGGFDVSDRFIAHARRDECTKEYLIHDLKDHLVGTADRAKLFASIFGNGDWVELAALWHDLGKFLPSWQAYIRRETGCDENVRDDGDVARPNHSSAGAVLALERLKQSPPARLLAFLIAGHHAGLPDWAPDIQTGGDLQNRLFDTLTQSLKTDELNILRHIPAANIFFATKLPRTTPMGIKTAEDAQKSAEHLHLWIRMAFSCLVDADFLDTEKFMSGKDRSEVVAYPSLDVLLSRFNVYMQKKQAEVDPTPLNLARAEILRQCRNNAFLEPGFYSLTVQTGGGKTLAAMAF